MITLPRFTHRNNICMLRYHPVRKTLGASQSMRVLPVAHPLWERCTDSNNPFCPGSHSKVVAELEFDPISYLSCSKLQCFIRDLAKLQRVCWLWFHLNNSLGKRSLMKLPHFFVGSTLYRVSSCLQGHSGTSCPLWTNRSVTQTSLILFSVAGRNCYSSLFQERKQLYSNILTKLQWDLQIWSHSAFESHTQFFPLLLLHTCVKNW